MLDYLLLTLCFLIITGPLGLLFNVTFIVCTALKRELQKDYTWFLCGMCTLNAIYCFNTCTLQIAVIVLDINIYSNFCHVVGIILATSGVGGICVQPMLALNRYVTIYHSYYSKKIFNRRNNILMMCIAFLFVFTNSIVLLYFGDLGRMGNTVCGPQIENMPLSRATLLISPVILSYCICIFCGYKILYLLKSHQANARRVELGSGLQEAKEIFRLMIIELIMPLILEIPVVLFCLVSSQIYIPRMLIAVSVCMFVVHPVCDPVIVVFVMKPYTHFIRTAFHKCARNTVEPTASEYAHSVRM